MNLDKVVEGVVSNFNTLTRYSIGGVVPFIAMHCIKGFDFSKEANATLIAQSIIATVALVTAVGSFLYGIHRAVVFPVLHWNLLHAVYRKPIPFEVEPVVPDLEFEHSYRIWQRRSDPKSMQGHLTEWASQVHFLYVTSLGILLGAMCRVDWQNDNRLSRCGIAMLIGMLVMGVALLHHRRYLTFEYRLQEKERIPQPPSETFINDWVI